MQDDFSLDSYNYLLPEENIAQHPAEKRDQSRLLAFSPDTGEKQHLQFNDIIQFFRKGDLLVVNDTKVIPARLFGKKETGGKAEVFLLEMPTANHRNAAGEHKLSCMAMGLIKSSKRPAIDSYITISEELRCRVIEYTDNGKVFLEMIIPNSANIADLLQEYGFVPLPPYIERKSGVSPDDQARYQTVYAANNGAVAAPTAGLHFTSKIFTQLKKLGVHIAPLTLHVGYGTFSPVRVDNITDHEIHGEYISITEETAERINTTKEKGGRIWAVGTTSVRALEYCSNSSGRISPYTGYCDLYIVPGYTYKIVDNLITNFHLPQSSLLFLVSALCGREKLLECYEEAIRENYRFYSYGDAMVILRN